MTLIEQAGLSHLPPGVPIARLSDQYARIRQAPRSIELERGAPLNAVLATYPPALPELIAKLNRTAPGRFPQTLKPHGLLLGMAESAREGEIQPLQGEPVRVAGEIAIFGEEDGHGAGSRNGPATRFPYLISCLVGRRHPDGPFEVLRSTARQYRTSALKRRVGPLLKQ